MPVLSALLLIALAQGFDGLSMWTDARGVVHVVASHQAPPGATVLEGRGYSVIDGDGRAEVLTDGGSRTSDSAWWRARFEQARLAVQASQALEGAAQRDVQEAEREVCVTATAKASARVVSRRRGRVIAEAHDEQTAQQCRRGTATGAMATALQVRRGEREQAERALRRLEQEAVAERVPLRDWR